MADPRGFLTTPRQGAPTRPVDERVHDWQEVYAGGGIGRALLVFAEDEAMRRGYKSIYLCTNSKMTENQILYSRIGYVEYDRRSQGDVSVVFMRKRLGSAERPT